MQVFNTIKKTEYNTAIALGFFDGVHKGHQAVINKCKANKSKNEKLAVLTFSDSPSNILSDIKKPLLTTNEEKFKLFEKMGVELVFCIDFNEVKNLSAESFVKNVLCDKLNAKTVATGFNYHFAKDGNATADDLSMLCKKHAITAHICESELFENEVISSTRIREYIKKGDIEKANQMLSYNFSVSSSILGGKKLGTKLKFPTINQPLTNKKVVPKFGVYATKVSIGDRSFFGACNIGTHPTVGEVDALCETHLLNFEGDDLYGDFATTELLHFIRPEKKFENQEQLKSQINKDVIYINKYFNI